MQDVTLENWQEMAMSRSVSDSSPRSLHQRKLTQLNDLKDLQMFPEGSNVGPGLPPNTPAKLENLAPSLEGMSKGLEASGIKSTANPSKELQIQTHLSKELTDRSSKQQASSPTRKTTSNIHNSPVLPIEEQTTSFNSNESFLDYSAKDESESLLKDQPKENNIRMSFSPWGKLLNMYSKMKKSPVPKLYSTENAQEVLKDDGQRIRLIVYRYNEKNPMVFSHFRTTDSVGFVEMEIKKMLDVHHDVRLWKKGLNDETSLLHRSDSTLKDAGIIHEQVLLLEEKTIHGSKSWH
ncbi:gametogenetin-binding protein 1-like [Leucoraja erinacea]|uniref:gametogenetin-binding protein 1-like n=1 Tax=Leucoraja erinaceus TaxID=7782 RepID=UPI002455A894|nr:gametogenetin-binding protein 1-like [Leucoraja erinacea]